MPSPVADPGSRADRIDTIMKTWGLRHQDRMEVSVQDTILPMIDTMCFCIRPSLGLMSVIEVKEGGKRRANIWICFNQFCNPHHHQVLIATHNPTVDGPGYPSERFITFPPGTGECPSLLVASRRYQPHHIKCGCSV